MSNEPSKQPRVPVLNVDGKPLMPTTPKKARLFIKDGLARVRKNKLGLFYIQMIKPVGNRTQPMALLRIGSGGN